MRTLTEKIRSILSSAKDTLQTSDAISFDFVKSRKGILKELTISKQSGNLIGVYSRALGAGMFITAVEAIELAGKDEVIVFHSYDMSGQKLPRTTVSMDEIQMVFPFNKRYENRVALAENR